jgi:hypothetical protein
MTIENCLDTFAYNDVGPALPTDMATGGAADGLMAARLLQCKRQQRFYLKKQREK